MDSKLLLVESILLLYRESQLPEGSDRSIELLKEIEASIPVPEISIESGSGRETIISLKNTLGYMLEQPLTYKFSKDNLLQRLRVNVGDEKYLYDIIKDGMEDLDEPEQINETCRQYRYGLQSHLTKSRVKEILKESSSKIMFKPDQVNWRTFVTDICDQLEPFTGTLVPNVDESLVGEIDLGDEESMARAMENAKKEMSTEGVLKLGWRGMNRLFGWHGGPLRGECILLGALQHKWKSGFLMNVPKQIAMYNKPHMLDSSKKPLILYISLENNVDNNLIELYKSMKGQEEGVVVDISTTDTAEAVRYIKEKTGVNGYHFKMLRFNGSEFTYRKFYDLLDRYQEDGYEIHMVSLDYLLLMSTQGCSGTNDAHMKRDLLRRLRNYTNPKKITFLTAAQLSSDAKQMIRDGVQDFVKEVVGKGYYDGCKGLDNEPDVELFLHLEEPGDGFTYVTMQRGKHRITAPQTSEGDKYVVYRFESWGLPEDINGNDVSRRRVGASTAAEGNKGSFWQSDQTVEEDLDVAA